MQFNLADMLEDVVDHVPERPALYAEGRRLTFREFDGRHEVPPDVAREGMQWLATR